MPVVYSALMCPAPPVHPAVSGVEASRCAGTTRAMREVADRLVRARPDQVLLLLPDAAGSGATLRGGPHRGDLGRQGAPGVRVDLPDAPGVAAGLPLPVRGEAALPPDAVVPLAFLTAAGWSGPTALLALPVDDDDVDALVAAIGGLQGRTAVVAAGTLSRRLRPDAPLGFHPKAAEFDHAFVQSLTDGGAPALARVPWRREAAEGVVAAAQVAAAAAWRAGAARGADVIHYEAPWGVGYAEAVFLDGAPPLYAVARRALADHFAGRPSGLPDGGPGAAALFVALGVRGGESRGCVGRLAPVARSLYAEVAEVALAAAFDDRRTRPLCAWELADLDIEVLLVDTPEPVPSPEAIDPQRHGVIVTTSERCGVQLPGRAPTPAALLAAARQRAGIPADAPAAIARFTVRAERRP